MSIIIGLDPGVNTGVAIYEAGALIKLMTITPWRIPEVLIGQSVSRVIFEDSRLQSHVWIKAKGAAGLKVARNIGEVDAWCKLIVATCETIGIPAHGISPKGKGAKLSAATFTASTGWTGKSNEHQRDAAMVAYPYRGAA